MHLYEFTGLCNLNLDPRCVSDVEIMEAFNRITGLALEKAIAYFINKSIFAAGAFIQGRWEDKRAEAVRKEQEQAESIRKEQERMEKAQLETTRLNKLLRLKRGYYLKIPFNLYTLKGLEEYYQTISLNKETSI